MMRLKDKVTLITGGAAGIGRATAERFAEEGARVIIGDVDKEAGQNTVESLDPKAEFYLVDVTDRKGVESWVRKVLNKYGRVDVLINNAGILRDALLVKIKNGKLIKQMSESDFDQVVAVKVAWSAIRSRWREIKKRLIKTPVLSVS